MSMGVIDLSLMLYRRGFNPNYGMVDGMNYQLFNRLYDIEFQNTFFFGRTGQLNLIDYGGS